MITDEMKLDDLTFNKLQAIVNAFANYFSSVYLLCYVLDNNINHVSNLNQPSDFQLSVFEVDRVMKSLSTNHTS